MTIYDIVDETIAGIGEERRGSGSKKRIVSFELFLFLQPILATAFLFEHHFQESEELAFKFAEGADFQGVMQQKTRAGMETDVCPFGQPVDLGVREGRPRSGQGSFLS